MPEYDVAIVGGGAAGLTAGMHTALLGYRTTIVERLFPCSQIMNAERIPNFPGFPTPIHGSELTTYLTEQALNAGVELQTAEVTELEAHNEHGVAIRDMSGQAYTSSAVILSVGSSLKKLGLVNEISFHGRGISECASCDGPLFGGKSVAVVGGGDSAIDEAITLSRFASDVTVLCRGTQLRAQEALVNEMRDISSITVRFGVQVQQLLGDSALTGVELHDLNTGDRESLDLDGLFVFIGLQPNTEWVSDRLDLTESGHIKVQQDLSTSMERVFAAGDVRDGSVAQLASVAGDGATAAYSVHRMLQDS